MNPRKIWLGSLSHYKEPIRLYRASLELDETNEASHNIYENIYKIEKRVQFLARKLGIELYPPPIRVTEPEQPELWWKQLLGRIGVRL